MTRYAIDAATLVDLVDRRVFVHPSHQLVAPNRIRSDALEILLLEVRGDERSDDQAMACHEGMTRLKMRLLGDRVSRRTAWQVAREHGWQSLRDAEYLAVGMLQADAFVTVDQDMASKASHLVPVATPRALGCPSTRRATAASADVADQREPTNGYRPCVMSWPSTRARAGSHLHFLPGRAHQGLAVSRGQAGPG